MVQRYKPPVNFRFDSVRTPTPEAIDIAGGFALLREAPANPADPLTPMIVVVNGTARTRVTVTPVAGQYRVVEQSVCDFAGIKRTEFLPGSEFHSSDEGLAGTADYYRTGTVLTAEWFAARKSFETAILGQTTLAALTAAFPPSSDANLRGYPGDLAMLTDASFYLSDGIIWKPIMLLFPRLTSNPVSPLPGQGWILDGGAGVGDIVYMQVKYSNDLFDKLELKSAT